MKSFITAALVALALAATIGPVSAIDARTFFDQADRDRH